MRRLLCVVLSLSVARIAAAEDAAPAAKPADSGAAAPAKPASALTPERAADAALTAFKTEEDAGLKALAAKDDPDPWLVADELIRRGEFDAADAFAKAAPRVDVEKLPAYVAARRGKSDDPARRARLAAANAALQAKTPAAALAALGAEEPGSIDDVMGVLIAMARGSALSSLQRLQPSASAGLAAADAAERLGWLSREARALHDSAASAFYRSAFAEARETFSRELSIHDRRQDRAAAAAALGNIGSVYFVLGDYPKALAAHERALVAMEASGDKAKTVKSLSNIGVIHQSLGDFSKALSAFERALAAQDALGDRAGAARTLGDLGSVYVSLGDCPKALSFYERALAAQEGLANAPGAAATLVILGNVYRMLGDYPKALSTHERARAAKEAMGDRLGATATLGSVGNVYLSMGDYSKALSAFERALAAMEAMGDKPGAAATLANMGSVHTARGDYPKALSTYERALAAMEAMGDKSGAAATLTNIGIVYSSLGDYSKALSTYERALAAEEARGEKAIAARTLGDIGNVYNLLGDLPNALSAHERALAAQEAQGDKWAAATTLGNLGNVYFSLGDRAKALSMYERALSAHEALGDRSGAARTLSNIGNVHHALGDYPKALSNYERALSEKEALGDRAGAAMTLGNIGGLYVSLRDYPKALEVLHHVSNEVSLLARGLGAEEGAGAREPHSFVFDKGVEASLAAKDPAEMAYFLESGRAGALLEGLRGREALWTAAIPEDLRQEEASARAREASATTALRQALRQDDLDVARTRRADLDLAREQVANVVSRIQRTAKAGAALVYPEPATLAAMKTTLGEGDALVLYATLHDAACALVVTRDDARIISLGKTADIAAAVEAVTLDSPDSDASPGLEALRRLVIGPLGLFPTTRRVLVSPAGGLSIVPFAALMSDRTVVYEPSGTTYALLLDEAKQHGSGVLALGDPDYATRVDARALAVRGGLALTPLPGTRDEVLAVGEERLLGAQATEAGLRAALVKRERWRAVHLACHGLVNPERPALSSLAVTPAGDDDGFLTCLDVFRMKIPADLVVLSACETGKGKIAKSEGIIGLTRAFMFAGSPRVICSLWKVNDDATRALMVEFYRLWNPKDGKPGLPTAEALREAQEFVRSHEKWKHPYYWAAWVLWGLPS